MHEARWYIWIHYIELSNLYVGEKQQDTWIICLCACPKNLLRDIKSRIALLLLCESYTYVNINGRWYINEQKK